MPVLSSTKDPENLTLTFVAEFDAPRERVWQVWEDPRQLERWWGPPGYPATFDQHDFRPGGFSKYYMTTPEGEKPAGWWRMVTIDPPSRIELEDGFADENGDPVENIPPGRVEVTFDEVDGRTRMTTVNRFVSVEQMEQVLQMGMEEGMREAMGQIDAVLAESRV
jgi:uncharacterized protein YndB with AHSA1/START domain